MNSARAGIDTVWMPLASPGAPTDTELRARVWSALRCAGESYEPARLSGDSKEIDAPVRSDLLAMVSEAAHVAAEVESSAVWCEVCEQWENPFSCPACSPGEETATDTDCEACAGTGLNHQPATPPPTPDSGPGDHAGDPLSAQGEAHGREAGHDDEDGKQPYRATG